mmetsp:Transcript_3027/g.5671  ORF Transcript_3027/g.5671 Transcript_3027/m.5671 type:complete len:99 (+) Transcript_3027:527-823(+)
MLVERRGLAGYKISVGTQSNDQGPSVTGEYQLVRFVPAHDDKYDKIFQLSSGVSVISSQLTAISEYQSAFPHLPPPGPPFLGRDLRNDRNEQLIQMST